ncbi:hypothetical protein BT96DRAFT_1023765 [Gymnopus androsaceus JB14]|uniref:ATP phosphoribosyltransferase catalytic domain-containing protein n=1 Tax=Gymnopus androsaceus JB14 TaxID=1447944 RepID=A0A6A4H4K8_9AGAR|nr:hypothetical protein BT96DRAFT_1023765 [Gymnopus androsaceus JB14]
MFSPAKPITVVLHGNDATGKTTLCRAINEAGQLCFTRGDEDPAHDVDLKTIDAYTLQLSSDDRQPPKCKYIAPDGTERHIVRVFLDAEIPTLQARIASRPSTDKWETEKALFYFRARFREIAAFFGFPLVRTDVGKTVPETVAQILDFISKPLTLTLLKEVSLRKLTPEKIHAMANIYQPVEGVNYRERLDDILEKECHENSLFTPKDILDQCEVDDLLEYSLVNSYDGKFAPSFVPSLDNITGQQYLSAAFRLVVEGESKQVYRLETPITNYFDDHLFVILKPTIYSHSMQATAEISKLSSIRAQGASLFLEMFNRSGVDHTYEALNRHGVVYVRATKITMIETIYKGVCQGTDKHSFYGMSKMDELTLDTSEYVGGPYVRFDWRNPNHTYRGVDVSRHPFYHIMERSVGKQEFYKKYLTGRATPFGDKCVPEDLVHSVQNVVNSQLFTFRCYLSIQWYMNQIGLEVQDGCLMVDEKGLEAWSEISQDCMRIKRRVGKEVEAFDKDMWRTGGSSAKDAIKTKWTKLNEMLEEYLAAHPFHTNEMISSDEPYGIIARDLLCDSRLKIIPKYISLYRQLSGEDRSGKGKSYTIGITGTKYIDKSDNFVAANLGILIIRPPGRSYKYSYEILDHHKYGKYFGRRNVIFFPMRPKDMPSALHCGTLDFAITSNTVMDESPLISPTIVSAVDSDLQVALICRANAQIDFKDWTVANRARIAAEYPKLVDQFLRSLGANSDTYVLQEVRGTTESFLVNDKEGVFLLCDGVVSTGKTLQENDLVVWKVVKAQGGSFSRSLSS